MRLLLSLVLKNLDDLPQSFNTEQWGVYVVGSGLGCPCIVRKTGSNGSMISIGHANDEVRIWSSADPNELHSQAVQRMMRMGYGYPFRRDLG